MGLHKKAYGIILYKVEKKDIKILLCLGVSSDDKWGCLKGSKNKDESAFICAKREFFEESSIRVDIALFEEYFEQINPDKDIGIWLVNASNIENIDRFFEKDSLLKEYLSWENTKVKYFSLKKLPKIKDMQKELIKNVKDFLESKSLFH
ncbi:NUDIX domain protein [Aliarcobacter thereius]|uniref:NUDIX domain protein n=2 Tax=Aliarcobacter thereius TaxID=544718 RepID=A0A1C0B6H8_9BACT|nr:NUDIX domain-containing protein [Aliarcobacter thereius]OCL86748.1 NUDIX domain protein [Aliarcobacter thereius]OCL90950.1 NUDIX domain protein [Aliarcobacter thereius]OCL96221.1 NUDIX domain protein [Aliarcobacter thereius LMG 24486]OCL98917.1 NUDIX domain protein [Aliarcobacter thereius]QBF15814.1 putative diadenosine tetraphosphate hydrolase [Aliarcobacter thereius LMG 24486]